MSAYPAAATALFAAGDGSGAGHGWLAAFTHPYFLHAFLAGSAIALAAGLTGYFLVLRAQVFTGDALSHVAFTGALAALAGGYDLRLGLFVATIAVALLIGGIGRKGRADDVVIGSVFAWILGLGAFFLTLYTTSRSAGNGGAGVNVLFGSIFGLSWSQALTAALVAAGISLAMLAIARPLLFASVDEAVAAARGVPVRLLGLVFLVLVGACAAEATQAVGSLLLLGLLAAPAGAATRLTDRPLRGLALSAGLGLGEMWAGLALSYAVPTLPPSFGIMAAATAVYGLTFLKDAGRGGAPAGGEVPSYPTS
ncbi:metal ABC transporter permease [Streptomyces sp. 8L]|uniref:metal ABC transporter permease n=1 Tax=Streptomyces sp. 8L TaxID=2877242 RepID=UPI001CD80E18|nr:metal ABC transporter permease [Streptomyces sp. 8L]MCA1221709.1 metal ABC transporter permease [Streptomyces sp. 8L]